MKKLIIVAGATYFVTRHWEKMSPRDKKQLGKQVSKVVGELGENIVDLGYKVAQVIGRGMEEVDYRMAWKKLGR